MTRFEKMEGYPDEIQGRFNSFIATQFDDSLSVEMQIRSIIKWAIDNFEEMDQTYNDFTEYILNENINPFIEFLNDLIEYMNEFVDTFDIKFQDEILLNLQKWNDDGTLETLINESLDTKYHEMDERLTAQLAHTNIDLDITKVKTDWIINIKEFGAVGDGVADDTVAVQSAIDLAFEVGGRVFIPIGDFRVDNLKLHQGTYIFGAGRTKSVLRGRHTNQHVIDHGGDLPIDSVVIRDLKVMGGMHSLRFSNVNDSLIDNVWVEGSNMDGIYLGAGGPGKPSNRNLITNVVVKNTRRNGISILDGTHNTIKDTLIDGVSGAQPEIGIDVEPVANSDTSHTTIDNVIVMNTGGKGIQVWADGIDKLSKHNKIMRNTVKNCGGGIHLLHASGSVVEDNTISDIDTSTTTYKAVIFLDGVGNHSVTVKNNYLEGGSIGDKGNNHIIEGNTIINSPSVGMRFAGGNKGHLIKNNNIINPTSTGIWAIINGGIIESNKIDVNGQIGILLQSESNLVSGNSVAGTPTIGINIDTSASKNHLVVNNLVQGSTVAGVRDYGTENTVVNNKEVT